MSIDESNCEIPVHPCDPRSPSTPGIHQQTNRETAKQLQTFRNFMVIAS